jgi:hypothetical protein
MCRFEDVGDREANKALYGTLEMGIAAVKLRWDRHPLWSISLVAMSVQSGSYTLRFECVRCSIANLSTLIPAYRSS